MVFINSLELYKDNIWVFIWMETLEIINYLNMVFIYLEMVKLVVLLMVFK